MPRARPGTPLRPRRTAPWGNPTALHDHIHWGHRHLGQDEGTAAHQRLILTHHKDVVMGDHLMDDNLQRHGTAGFEGGIIRFGSDDSRLIAIGGVSESAALFGPVRRGSRGRGVRSARRSC